MGLTMPYNPLPMTYHLAWKSTRLLALRSQARMVFSPGHLSAIVYCRLDMSLYATRRAPAVNMNQFCRWRALRAALWQPKTDKS